MISLIVFEGLKKRKMTNICTIIQHIQTQRRHTSNNDTFESLSYPTKHADWWWQLKKKLQKPMIIQLTSSETKSPNRSKASTQSRRRARSDSHAWLLILILQVLKAGAEKQMIKTQVTYFYHTPSSNIFFCCPHFHEDYEWYSFLWSFVICNPLPNTHTFPVQELPSSSVLKSWK